MKTGEQEYTKESQVESEAKIHIELLRKNKFSIGAKDPNPLTQDLNHAVTCLSAELYAKDVHFLMELIQNAEDNAYSENVEPTLEFALTTQDITGSGAPLTLLVFNNEIGFMRQNMESICSVGRSTKKGKRGKGFIGEKGIGFKSVFLVSKYPHIISNGYKVRFSEEPDKNCGIGYIVPEWISDESIVSKLQAVYGCGMLPTTTIVLPLKQDKINPVKQELATLHPELLLFLSKLRRLYVHEKVNSVTAISIASETHRKVIKDQHADSCVVHLSVKEKSDVPEEKCQYYIWRQSFPVKREAKVSGRTDVEQWIVSLAFPFGERLKRGTSSVGIFSFLPTSMVTNFPFVIQSDFILASSRETIALDSKWNLGILECVPYAFVNAFTSCVKEGSSVFTFGQVFEFLPVHPSPFPKLNEVRETIQSNLSNALIVPCEVFENDVRFCKSSSTTKPLNGFRKLLFKMKKAGVSLAAISTMEISLVHSSLAQCLPSLEFLGVQFRQGWFEKCIIACNLVSQAPDDLYIDLLHFVFSNRSVLDINGIPWIKFVDKEGRVKVSKIKAWRKVLFGYPAELHAWLLKCNTLFGCPNNMFFLPKSIQAALITHPKGPLVSNMIRSHGVTACSAFEYAFDLCDFVSSRAESNLVLRFSHFIYHCKRKKFLSDTDLSAVLKSIPIIDGSGLVKLHRCETLVPSRESKWAKLLGQVNPFIGAKYVDIGEVYSTSDEFAGEHTPDAELLNFLKDNCSALDLPEISPPTLALKVASTELTSEQAFLLLDWLRFHRTRASHMPGCFIESLRLGKWVKTKSGVDCPSNCTIPNETGRSILELMKGVVFRFSIVDVDFYGEKILSYSEELKFLGVRCGINDVQDIVKDHFKIQAADAMSKETVFSLVLFMGFLKERRMLDEPWLNTISQGRWIKTLTGCAAPRDSVLPLSYLQAEALMEVTSVHVIDVMFYGEELRSFIDELKLLGVKSESEVYALAVENLYFPDDPSSLSSNCGLFLLKCLRHEKSTDSSSFPEKLQTVSWLKTNLGFKCPSEAILDESDWASLLKIAKVPVIDEDFYGSDIRSYVDELKALGVGVEFQNVWKIIVEELKSLLLSSLGTPEHFIALLNCMSEMRSTGSSLLDDICRCLQNEEILKTRHGYKKPGECILFNSKWASISLFVDLPLIDDSFYGIKIYGFRDDLRLLGVLSRLEECAIFVVRGLTAPIESTLLTADGTLSLLECLKILMANSDESPFIGPFIENMRRSELLMTSCGYRLPASSLLLQNAWAQMLELTDAPFINDKFYGTEMSTYLSQLKVIGVKVDPKDICNALSAYLPLLTESPPIKRIYRFLKEFQWKPDSSKAHDFQIWIPSEDEKSNKGQWVDCNRCVLHGKEHYFSLVLYSLDIYYEKELLSFFSSAYGVRECPLTNHYLQIWSLWERMETHELLESECCFFWGYILENWNSETEDILTKTLTKVPAFLADDEICLVSKEDVFVPDDLWLKKMFMNPGDSPLFVWLPKRTFSGVPAVKLCGVYYSLGVKKISESVKCSVSITQSFCQPNNDLKKKLIVKGLIEIVLGFLACKIHMPMKERHKAAKSLLSLSVFENGDNIQVSYQLCLTDGRFLETTAAKLVHWDKTSQRLFIDVGFSENLKESAEFVNFFAVEIAEGVLPQERAAVVNELRNLVQTGCLLGFRVDAVKFLLTRENIEVSMEDEEFLAAMVVVGDVDCASVSGTRLTSDEATFSPLTPIEPLNAKRRRLGEIGVVGRIKLKDKSTDAGSDIMMSSQKKVAAKRDEKRDPNMPKRPLSPFKLFMAEFREQYKSEHPGVRTVAAKISKAASKAWKAMPDEEKSPLVMLAEKKKAEYNEEIKVYNTKMVEARRACVKDVNDDEEE